MANTLDERTRDRLVQILGNKDLQIASMQARIDELEAELAIANRPKLTINPSLFPPKDNAAR